MPAAKKHKVGESVEVKDCDTVVRPDGRELQIVGGIYFLDAKGTHKVAGTAYEVS